MELKEKVKSHIKDIKDFPKQGIIFKDIAPIFKNSDLVKEIIQSKKIVYQGKIDVVVGIESRGFLLALPLALELNIPFVMMRKKGKLPPPILGKTYELEYGTATLELQEGSIKSGSRALVHDDVLATGGTILAACELIESCEGKVSFCDFLIELSLLNARERLINYEIESTLII